MAAARRPVGLALALALAFGALLAGAAKDARPNVVLLMSDQWRFDWTPTALPALRMPTFTKLAAEGTRFLRATVPSPLCHPCRASLASGLKYSRAGVPTSNHQDEFPVDVPTIYQLLRDSGVYPMIVGKDDLTLLGKLYGQPCEAGAKPLCGTKRAKQLGFERHARCYGKDFANFVRTPVDPYMESLFKCNESEFGEYLKTHFACNNASDAISYRGYFCPGVSKVQQEHYIDDWIADRAKSLILSAPADKPFFLQVNYAGPHPPLVATKEMRQAEGEARAWPNAYNSTGLSSKVQQTIRRNYALLIENIDRLNQEILDALERRGDGNNTVVCIFSDHGEMLGDFWDRSAVFEPFQKTSPWEASVAVPLVCSGPGVLAGREVQEPVSTLDLASTVLDLQGVEVPDNFDSVSLKGTLLGGEHDGHPAVSTINFGMHRFSTAQKRFKDGHVWKLTCCQGLCPYGLDLRPGAQLPVESGWERMLFDLTEDPLEQRNLYHSRPDIAAVLRPTLEAPFAGCGEAEMPRPPAPHASSRGGAFLAKQDAQAESDDTAAFFQERAVVGPVLDVCPAPAGAAAWGQAP